MSAPTTTQFRERKPTLTKDSKLSEVEASLLDGLSPKSVPTEPEDKPAPPLVYRPGVLVKPLTSFYEMLGGFVTLGDPICGAAIIGSANECAKSLDELARVNPQVRKVLMRMIAGSVWTKVTIAHLPIIVAVMGHHSPQLLANVMGVFITKKNEETVKS